MLQDTRNDVRDKLWTKPMYREVMKLRRRITRAREEIVRCNVETRRIHTAIINERQLFRATEKKYAGKPIAGPLNDFILGRRRQNRFLYWRIQQIHSLPGFSGDKTIGIRLGSPTPTASSTAAPGLSAPPMGALPAHNVSTPVPPAVATSLSSDAPSHPHPHPTLASLATVPPMPSMSLAPSAASHIPGAGPSSFHDMQPNKHVIDNDDDDDDDFDDTDSLFGLDNAEYSDWSDLEMDEEMEEEVGSLTQFLAGLNT